MALHSRRQQSSNCSSWQHMSGATSCQTNVRCKDDSESINYFNCQSVVPSTDNTYNVHASRKKWIDKREHECFHIARPLTSPSLPSTWTNYIQLPAHRHQWVAMNMFFAWAFLWKPWHLSVQTDKSINKGQAVCEGTAATQHFTSLIC
jgi:hypothetical protein